MISFYFRFAYFMLLWLILFRISIIAKNELPFLLLFCAISLTMYFFLPLIKYKQLVFCILLISTFLFSIFVPLVSIKIIILIMYFYLFEAAFQLKAISFRMTLLIGGLLLVCIIYLNIYELDLLIFLLLATILAIPIYHLWNSANSKLEEQKILYDQIIDEYRRMKRQALKDEHSARLEERTRIARDMHDSVGHQLTALGMYMEVAKAEGSIEQHIPLMKKMVEECLEETRKAVRALQTDEIEGISAVLHLIRKLESESHLRIHFMTKEGVLGISLPNKQSILLYRVIQEGLTNAMKYGASRSVWITLGISPIGHLSFEIKNAFQETVLLHEGFGLKNIRERLEEIKGSFHIYQKDHEFIMNGTLPLGEIGYEENPTR